MGAEHEDLRPTYTELCPDMEIETEEVLAPSDDDDSHGDNSENDESGDENDQRNEEEKEDDSFNVFPGTFDEKASNNFQDECEEEKQGEFSDDEDAESDQDCHATARGAFNPCPHLDFDLPLSPEVRPACTPYDFTIPMFNRFWDDDTTCFCGEWPLHCEREVCGVDVWPSRVFLPQMMVWSRPYEHCSSTKDNQPRKPKRGRDSRRKRRKVKRLGKSSVFMSSKSKSSCHHEGRRNQYCDKALRHAMKLQWHRRREVDHFQRLTKYFTKAAMEVAGCSCDYSSSQDQMKCTSKRKARRKCEPRDEIDSSAPLEMNTASKSSQNNELETDKVTKTDITLSWDEGKQFKPDDPLANWSKWREYFNKTLRI